MSRATQTRTWRKRILEAFAIVAGSFGLIAVATVPSFAATSCTGSTCSGTGSQTAQVEVNTSITLTLDQSAVDFGPYSGSALIAPQGAGPGGPFLVATVNTNDTSGYSLSSAATDFGPGAAIPATDLMLMSAAHPNLGSLANNIPYVEGDGAVSVGSTSTVSAAAGDAWNYEYKLTPPGNLAPGTYSATVSWLAAAN